MSQNLLCKKADIPVSWLENIRFQHFPQPETQVGMILPGLSQNGICGGAILAEPLLFANADTGQFPIEISTVSTATMLCELPDMRHLMEKNSQEAFGSNSAAVPQVDADTWIVDAVALQLQRRGKGHDMGRGVPSVHKDDNLRKRAVPAEAVADGVEDVEFLVGLAECLVTCCLRYVIRCIFVGA